MRDPLLSIKGPTTKVYFRDRTSGLAAAICSSAHLGNLQNPKSGLKFGWRVKSTENHSVFYIVVFFTCLTHQKLWKLPCLPVQWFISWTISVLKWMKIRDTPMTIITLETSIQAFVSSPISFGPSTLCQAAMMLKRAILGFCRCCVTRGPVGLVSLMCNVGCNKLALFADMLWYLAAGCSSVSCKPANSANKLQGAAEGLQNTNGPS